MAQFTYELGVLYSGLIAVFLLWENCKRYWRQTIFCILDARYPIPRYRFMTFSGLVFGRCIKQNRALR